LHQGTESQNVEAKHVEQRQISGRLQAAFALRTPSPDVAVLGQSTNAQATKIAGGSKYVYLDLARGLAAMLVLAGHLRAFVFADLSTVGHVSVLWKVFYLLTSLGQQAVMVFFVLSGFLITKNISQLANSKRWSWAEYAAKRVSRLWIVLVPALALTFAWDQLGIAVTGSRLYSGDLNSVYHSTPMSALSYSISTAIGNLFFLQTIVVPPFGSNGPLWSLANEFWYYAIFPLVFFAFRGQATAVLRVAFAVVAIGLCIWLPKPLVLLGVVWLMGYGVYLVLPFARRLSGIANASVLIFGLLVLLACVLLTKSGKLHDSYSDYSIGLSFSIVLVALTQLRSSRLLELGATFLSNFSYTLYLVHFPFLAFIFSFTFRNARYEPGLRGAFIFAAAFIAAAAYAYGIYWVFERNTARLQTGIIRRIRSKRAASVG
jgi:peptidoglycan/LPS O-acetylase OafA/YrhL